METETVATPKVMKETLCQKKSKLPIGMKCSNSDVGAITIKEAQLAKPEIAIGIVVLSSHVNHICQVTWDDHSTNCSLCACLFELERKFAICENHLDGQEQVTQCMRETLINWVNGLHLYFELRIDSYYLTVAIIDRYLEAITTTKRNEFQLVGATALFIASKYKEMHAPCVKEFADMTANTYTDVEIIAMEQLILKHLRFNLIPPLVIHFTRRFFKAAIRRNLDYDHTMSIYFTELASIEYSLVHHLPSAIAAAAIFISLKLTSTPDKLNDEIWTTTLQHYTTHTLNYLRSIICTIAKIALHAPQDKENAVYRKYCIEKYDKVALRSVIYGPVMKGLLVF